MDTALTAPDQPTPDRLAPDPQAGDAPWRFQKGESGNPGGRPKGARNRATLLMEQLLGAEIEGVTRAAVGRAMGGDVAAMRLCFQRIAPIVRSRAVVQSGFMVLQPAHVRCRAAARWCPGPGAGWSGCARIPR